MDELIGNDYEEKYNAFYFLCNKSSQSEYLKSLLSNSEIKKNLDIYTLTAGLLGAAKNNNLEYFPIIINHIEKNNIEINLHYLTDIVLTAIDKNNNPIIKTTLDYMDKKGLNSDANIEPLQVIFNYLTSNNKMNLANELDIKYSILKKSISNEMPKEIKIKNGSHSDWLTLHDGNLEVGGFMGDFNEREEKIAPYIFNPILFNLINFNPDLLDSFFSHNYEIHPSLLTHAIVSILYLDNQQSLDKFSLIPKPEPIDYRKSINYLLSKPKFINIIQNNKEIQDFLNNEKDINENKKSFKSSLLMIKLNSELKNDNKTVVTKPKI